MKHLILNFLCDPSLRKNLRKSFELMKKVVSFGFKMIGNSNNEVKCEKIFLFYENRRKEK